MIKLNRVIFFDLDGTIADLYGVENWLADLISYNPRPYKEAKVLINMSQLARRIHILQNLGYEIGIISWLSKNSTPEYDKSVTAAKLKWLKNHLPSVNFDKIHIVPYGTPKSNFATSNDLLFDDELKNRLDWVGAAFSPNEILTVLKELTLMQ